MHKVKEKNLSNNIKKKNTIIDIKFKAEKKSEKLLEYLKFV